MHDVLRDCKGKWRRLGVRAEVSAEMAEELQAELIAAAADGVPAMAFVGGDPAGFAHAWASARGVVRGRRRLMRICVGAFVGAMPGALTGLFVAYGVSSTEFARLFQDRTMASGIGDSNLSLPTWLVLLLYLMSGLLSYLGALAAVSVALRRVDDPERPMTVRRLRLGLPVGGAAGVAVAVWYGSTTGFNTDWPHPGVEAALAAAGVLGAAVTSRRGSVRREPSRAAFGSSAT